MYTAGWKLVYKVDIYGGFPAWLVSPLIPVRNNKQDKEPNNHILQSSFITL